MLELYREIVGEVLKPTRQIEKSRLVILNNVSNIGTWDTALSLAISEQDGAAEASYKKWHSEEVYEDRSGDQVAFTLGSIQFTPFKPVPGAAICNVIGYQGVTAAEDTRSPLRYYALAKGLTEVYQRLAESISQGAKVEVVVSPQFASGGSWNWVAVLLKELAQDSGVPTTVYKAA